MAVAVFAGREEDLHAFSMAPASSLQAPAVGLSRGLDPSGGPVMRIRQWIAVASGMAVVGGLVLAQAPADAADVAGVQNIVVTDTTARANDIKVENGGLS